MPRVPGWANKLNKYLTDAQEIYKETGLVYGQFDCCTFIAEWVEICTGEDLYEEYRDNYTSADEGWALLAEIDGTLVDALTKRFGDPIHPAFAQKGDIVYSEDIDGCGICLVQGTQMKAIFLGVGGFTLHRVRDCTHAFRVGA